MIKSLASGQKAALIINECQKGLLDPDYALFPALAKQVQERGIVQNIAALAQAFRNKSFPVFFTPICHRPDFAGVKPNSLLSALILKNKSLIAGSAQADPVAELQPLEGDFVIQRTSGLIAFQGTNLDITLRRMDVETVVITGVSTNVGVAGAAFGAADGGYHVVVPEDCIGGSDPETQRILVNEQLRMVATIGTKDEVIAALG